MHELSSERLDKVIESLVGEIRCGRDPDLEAYCALHPALAGDLRELYPLLEQLELARSLPNRASQGRPPGGEGLLPDAGSPPLGDYRVLRELGRGGMGIVYEALQESLGRRVALKILAPSAAQNPRYLRRFQREAQAAARLHHTNIVPVLGVGEDQGLHYLVMQQIEGVSLDRVLLTLRTAPGASQPPAGVPTEVVTALFGTPQPVQGRDYWAAVARIGLQAAEAIHYAHGMGLVHRDIKPSNLLVDSQGTVWVADFGLAKLLDGDELTESGELLGTLRYLPPERLRGQSDHRGDIYGLGATLYELATGSPPFAENDKAILLALIAQGQPRAPRAWAPALPRDLETIVVKALAKEADQRYPTAGALAEDLRRFLADVPIRARRPSPVERLARWCRRHPDVAIPSAASVLLLVALTLGSLLAAARFGHENQLTRAAERKAVAAEHQRRRELFGVNLARAEELGASGGPGQRFGGLAAIGAALDTLEGDPPSEAQRLALAHAAIVCLTHGDLREIQSDSLPGQALLQLAFDRDLKRLTYGDTNGQGSVVRELGAPPDAALRLPSDSDEPSVVPNWQTFSRSGRLLLDVQRPAPHDRERFLVWEWATRRRLIDFTSPSSRNLVDISPDDRHLLLAGADGVMRRIELASGQATEFPPPLGYTACLRFDPGGTLVALASSPYPKICDARTWEVLVELPEASGAWTLDWSSPGLLALGLNDGRIYLWDHSRRRGRFLTDQMRERVELLRVSDDGRVLCASTRNQALVWRLDRDTEFCRLPFSASLSADGQRIGGISEGRAVVFELVESNVLKRLALEAEAATFSPDGETLVLSGQFGVRLYAGHSLVELGDLGLDPAGPVGFDADGQALLTYGKFSPLLRWGRNQHGKTQWGPPAAVEQGRAVRPPPLLMEPQHQGRQAVCAPGGGVAWTDYRHGQVVWKPPGDGGQVLRLDLPNAQRVCLSADGRWLAGTAYLLHLLRVWNTADGSLVCELPGRTDAQFSADGRWLATAGFDSVQLLDTATWKRKSSLLGPARHGLLRPLAFQPRGGLLAVSTGTRTIDLFDPETSAIVAVLTHPTEGAVKHLAFSSDGCQLAATRDGGDVLIWNLARLTKELEGQGLSDLTLAPADLAAKPEPDPVLIDRGALPPPGEWYKYWVSLALGESRQARWLDAANNVSEALAHVAPEDQAVRASLLGRRALLRAKNLDLVAARDDCQEVLRTKPEAQEAQALLARLLILGPAELQDLPRGLGLAATLEALGDDQSPGRVLHGLALIALGRGNEGRPYLLDEGPGAGHWHQIAALGLAWEAAQRGDTKSAQESLARAEQLFASSASGPDAFEHGEVARLRARVAAALASSGAD